MGQIRSRDSKVGAGADTNLSSLKSPKVTGSSNPNSVMHDIAKNTC